MQVEENVWVTVRYRLYDSQGEALEEGEREWTYLHGGHGAIFPRIEAELAGLSQGETASMYLEPEDTFGDYDAALLQVVARSRFPGVLEPGMTFDTIPGEAPDGVLYTVTDLTDEAVVIERGVIAHRGRSADLLADHATLDRYIGLKMAEDDGL